MRSGGDAAGGFCATLFSGSHPGRVGLRTWLECFMHITVPVTRTRQDGLRIPRRCSCPPSPELGTARAISPAHFDGIYRCARPLSILFRPSFLTFTFVLCSCLLNFSTICFHALWMPNATWAFSAMQNMAKIDPEDVPPEEESPPESGPETESAPAGPSVPKSPKNAAGPGPGDDDKVENKLLYDKNVRYTCFILSIYQIVYL